MRGGEIAQGVVVWVCRALYLLPLALGLLFLMAAAGEVWHEFDADKQNALLIGWVGASWGLLLLAVARAGRRFTRSKRRRWHPILSGLAGGLAGVCTAAFVGTMGWTYQQLWDVSLPTDVGLRWWLPSALVGGVLGYGLAWWVYTAEADSEHASEAGIRAVTDGVGR